MGVPFTLVLTTSLAVCSLLLVCVPAHAQILRQLTDLNRDDFLGWHVDDGGRTAVAVWRGDPLGTNPNHVYQIFKWDLPGGTLTQLTHFSSGLTRNVSISDGGEWIVFDSRADPVHQNGDGTPELFLMRSDGTDITQLTNDDLLGGGNAECPAISGSGNRVLFYGTYDPNGTNPDHLTQLFVLDLASSSLTQLTQGDSGVYVPYSTQYSYPPNGRCYPSISDNGERIAFSSSADLTGANPEGGFEVFGINADGQNLAQLSSPVPSHWHFAWGISGNGQRVVIQTADLYYVEDEVWVVDWDGSGQTHLDEGWNSTITDDGTRVYYHAEGPYAQNHIFIIVVASLVKTQLTSTSVSIENRSPVISRAANRIVFLAEHGQYPGGSNPDMGPELMAMDGNGNDLQQLTANAECRWALEPDITAGGTRVVYRSVDGWYTAYGLDYVDTDGPDSVSVITADSIETPTVTADGETIVFMSWYDLTGNGTCPGYADIFRVQTDGTGLAQLTSPPDCGSSVLPVVAANGSLVVFQSTGFGSGTGTGVYSMPLGGGPVTPVDEDEFDYYKNPMVSADGMWTAWYSEFPPQQGVLQVFRGRTDGSAVETLTDDPVYHASDSDISGDGRLVVYMSRADPLGTNADHDYEIFLYDAQAGILRQVTETSEGYSSEPRISDDGEWVYFLSRSPFFDPAITLSEEYSVFRFNVGTGVMERAGAQCLVPLHTNLGHPNLAVDADGGRAVFVSVSAPTGERLPRSYDVWLSDFDTPATIRPSAEAPTVVEWDADPRAVDYDVIRGDVANLAAGAGNTVDLGTVVCLENDTFNTDTAGAEADADQPAPGQVFFFLRRWTQGASDTPSYGQGSGGAERVPSGGDCAQ